VTGTLTSSDRMASGTSYATLSGGATFNEFDVR
jgi:hypothetical protein